MWINDSFNVDYKGLATGSFTFPAVRSNQEITATFKMIQYTVTASAGTEGSITPSGPVTVDCGDSRTFYFGAEATCYEIDQVLIDGVNNPAAVTAGTYTFSNITANHTIQVTFKKKTYTIVAAAGPNGNIDPVGSVLVTCGEDQTFDFWANSGFEVAYVYVDGVIRPDLVDAGSFTFEDVMSNHSITVMFKSTVMPPAYTIIATTDGGATIAPSGAVTVGEGTDKTFTFTAKKGFEIVEVLIDGANDPSAVVNGFYTFENVQDNHTIHVKCEPLVADKYIIHVTYGQGGSISPNGDVTVQKGTNSTFNIIPQHNYKINEVWIDGILNPQAVIDGFYTFYNVQEEHWIHATFTFIIVEQFYINASVSTVGGVISPSGKVFVETNDEPSFTFTALDGYQLQDVLVDGISVIDDVVGGVYTFKPITSSHTIVGKFEKKNLTITASIGTAGGIISPLGEKIVPYGGSQAYTITAQTGFLIDEVLINGVNNPTAVSSGKYTFSNVTENQTIVANFKYRTYPITATQGTNGLVTPEGTTDVNHGDNITYYIAPNTGFAIKTVLINGKNNPAAVTNGYYTFTNVTAKQTISATFTPLANAPADNETIANELLLYPNPTSGELKIENGKLKIENVEIYDVLGRKQEIIFNFQLSTFNLIDLPTGIYFVRIKTETGVEMRKVIKN